MAILAYAWDDTECDACGKAIGESRALRNRQVVCSECAPPSASAAPAAPAAKTFEDQIADEMMKQTGRDGAGVGDASFQPSAALVDAITGGSAAVPTLEAEPSSGDDRLSASPSAIADALDARRGTATFTIQRGAE